MPHHVADLAILTAIPDGPLPTADRLVLLEADLTRSAHLRRDHSELEVIDAMLAAESGKATLIEWNLPRLRTLRSPNSTLIGLFPGLREVARQQVERLSPEALLTRLGALPERVTLYLDVPGETADLLAAIERSGWLAYIDTLNIRCGNEVFFAGEEDADTLSSRLEMLGFRESDRDISDPDLPVLYFIRDPERQKLLARLANFQSDQSKIELALTTEKKARTEAEAGLRTEQTARAEAEEALRTEQTARAEAEEALRTEQTARTKVEAALRTEQAKADEVEADLARQKDSQRAIFQAQGQIDLIKDLLLGKQAP